MQYQADAMGGSTSELASPGSRLAAWIIDSLIVVVLLVIAFFAGLVSLGSGFGWILPVFVIYLAVLIVQIYFLVTRAQTIGKIAMKIRIVDAVTGGHPGWARLIFLRVIVHSILTGIPFIGFIYFLVDSLFVFRADHRTIHDMIAGTQVDKVTD